MVWGAIAGAAASLIGGKMAADSQKDAADKAAEAAQFDPYNVQGGFGQAYFDRDNQTSGYNPSQQTLGYNNYYGQQFYNPNYGYNTMYGGMQPNPNYVPQQPQYAPQQPSYAPQAPQQGGSVPPPPNVQQGAPQGGTGPYAGMTPEQFRAFELGLVNDSSKWYTSRDPQLAKEGGSTMPPGYQNGTGQPTGGVPNQQPYAPSQGNGYFNQGGSPGQQFDITSMMTGLTPQQKAQRRQYFNLSRDAINQMELDPMKATQQYFDRGMNVLQADQERQQSAFFDKLNSMGRMGTTGGAQQLGEFFRGQSLAQNQLLMDSSDQARRDQAALYEFGRGAQGISGGLNEQERQLYSPEREQGFINQFEQRKNNSLAQQLALDNQNLKYLDLGGIFGGRQASGGAATAGFTNQAYSQNPWAGAMIGAADGISKGVDSIDWGGMFNGNSGYSSGGAGPRGY